MFKKVLSLLLVLVLAFSLTACSKDKKDDSSSKDTGTPTESANTTDSSDTGSDTEGTDSTGLPEYADLVLGEDYTDITADLHFLTHRTDIVDSKLAGYVEDFRKMYPNVTITYEGITDYVNDVTTRLTTSDWGDICMIPTTVDKVELPNLFLSFGAKDKLEEKYDYLNNFAYQNQVYGLPSTVNAQGIVYNKKVFEQAGITEIPKTPDEFLDALQKIKDNTDAIPLYTNYAAGWTMTAWDAYIGGSATGDPDFMNNVLVHSKDPFANRGDMTGPYAVYYVLYNAVQKGLIEDDYTTTDWESSKGKINRGEIGTMVLGSWAIAQMQGAGDNPDDIGYMPFPITINGKQYASAGPDYCYGINVNSSDDNKIAAMLYVKYLVEKSQFAYTEGGISIVKGDPYPATLDSFSGVELVIDNPSPEGEETFFNDLNSASELGLNADNVHVSKIVDAAYDNSQSFDDIMADWNERWSEAQQSKGIEVK